MQMPWDAQGSLIPDVILLPDTLGLSIEFRADRRRFRNASRKRRGRAAKAILFRFGWIWDWRLAFTRQKQEAIAEAAIEILPSWRSSRTIPSSFRQ